MSLYRICEFSLSLFMCPWYDTKLDQRVRLQFQSSGECGVLFYCSRSTPTIRVASVDQIDQF